MLKLAFLTEEEQAARLHGRKVYTDSEVNELSIMATGIKDLVEIMARYTCHEEDISPAISVFNILEVLIAPVADFLYEGAIKEYADPGDRRRLPPIEKGASGET
ncbi:hypothetical protein FACS189479_05070 [Spirochaetia bacterium]|nr:hypothetical protein FACS189479_05070 [Spirochaetia bacterium]